MVEVGDSTLTRLPMSCLVAAQSGLTCGSSEPIVTACAGSSSLVAGGRVPSVYRWAYDRGGMAAALPAGQLVDVAVRRAKVAPPAAAHIHHPAEELHARCLQLPHGGGQIVDHEADDRTGGEVPVVLVAWAEHLERAPSGNWKAA